MNIAGLSTSLSMAQVQNDFSTAVLAKQMDTQEAMGAKMIDMMNRSMMEQSVVPTVGANIDIMA